MTLPSIKEKKKESFGNPIFLGILEKGRWIPGGRICGDYQVASTSVVCALSLLGLVVNECQSPKEDGTQYHTSRYVSGLKHMKFMTGFIIRTEALRRSHT